MASQELLDRLNQQLNREVTTLLRHMLQAASIKGAQYESVREMYLEEVTDEVGHAQYLANQIEMLGGTPELDPDLSPPPSDISEMLQSDAEEEKRDVENYEHLASLAAEENLVALKNAMEEQAVDEDEHSQEMRRLLG